MDKYSYLNDRDSILLTPSEIQVGKWNDEARLGLRGTFLDSMGLFSNTNGVLTSESSMVSILYRATSIKPDYNDEGGLDLEILLKSRPASNVFTFAYTPTLLDARVQGALTQQEKAFGGVRPAHVLNSISFYHSTKSNFFQFGNDGEKYKTGKHSHLYRMLATDNLGRTSWADWSIPSSGIFALVIDNTFLKNASYPVKIAPLGDTIGFTSIGGTLVSDSGDYILGTAATAASGGSINSVSWYLPTDANDDGPRQLGVYTLAGASSVLIGNSAESSGETPDNWVTLTVTGTIVNGTSYWVIHWGAEIAGRYDSGYANGARYVTNTYSGSLPNPLGKDYNTADIKYSIYCTYGVSGGWSNIAKVGGVTAAAMGKMNGVAVANIAKVNGTAV